MKNNNNKNPTTPPPPSLLTLPQISHIYAIIQYSHSKIFVAEHMIVSPHQPRCQDIMANVLGVCAVGDGKGGGIRIMYVAPGLSFISLFHLLLLTACVLLIDRL